MIDFEKELQKFHFFDTDGDADILENEAAIVIDSFNSVLKKLGKDQSNANTQLEELVVLIDEGMEKSRSEEELKKQINTCEVEKLTLVKGFIEILDQMEDLYRYSSANDYGNWTTQIRLLWDNIYNSLIILGVVRVEGLNTMFNPLLNTVKMTRDLPDVQDGLILDVLRSGYIYKTAVIRKAEVVVNKKIRESEACEQDSWDRSGDVDL